MIDKRSPQSCECRLGAANITNEANDKPTNNTWSVLTSENSIEMNNYTEAARALWHSNNENDELR